MKRRLFKTIALAICLCSTVGALVGKTLDNEQRWFTVDDTGKAHPLNVAPCDNTTTEDCAQLFERASSTSSWTPVLDVNGNPIMAYGERTDQ
ncbi:hypothetical protein SAMN05216436_108121 [bacterium A37T11]|nr:hypothetical protein SAMN05216436_108121 [bacterium A37T11]